MLTNMWRQASRRKWPDIAQLTQMYLRNVAYNSQPRKAYNFLLNKLQKRLRNPTPTAFPYRYRLEPTNICNLRCPACATGLGILGRRNGRMPLDQYRRIIDQIAPYAYTLYLFYYGEPLLHPQIFDMIRYAEDQKIHVIINSHMNHFSPEMAQEMVASRLGRINISLDGSTQEVYEKYRVGGQLQKVLDHTRLLVEEKKRQKSFFPLINLRFLVTKQNEHQVESSRQLAHELGVTFTPAQFFFDFNDPAEVEKWLPTGHNLQDYVHAAEYDETDHCADLWETLTVYWDGSTALCCWFNHPEHTVANLFEQPLAEIWNSPPFVHGRKVFTNTPPDQLLDTTCKECRGRPLAAPAYLKHFKPQPTLQPAAIPIIPSQP